MGLTTFGKYNIEDTADFTVYIPKTDPLFATSLAVIPLQLLGYYISVATVSYTHLDAYKRQASLDYILDVLLKKRELKLL